MEEKLNELKELMGKRYDKQFTEEEVKSHCVAIIYNGVFKNGWSLNGVKHFDNAPKEEYPLTTGQMIDQLKKGEIAENMNGWQVAFDDYYVLRIIGHSVSTVDHGLGSKYYISSYGAGLKWKIQN